MYVLLTDESNLDAAPNIRFFVYGGLFFPVTSLVELDRGIAEIRTQCGYRPDDILKFETRQRPQHVDIGHATEAKRRVVELCRRTNCKFIAYGALHAIINQRPRDEQVLYGANSVIDRFNRFLEREDEYGIVLTDTLPVNSPNQYMREKFSRGLQFGVDFRPLSRIRLFGSTCAGASHVASSIDIVLGCFRYAINSPPNHDAAGEMIANVTDLMWGYRRNDEAYVLESGLILRPMLANIQVNAYRREYEQLLQRLDELDAHGLRLRDGA